MPIVDLSEYKPLPMQDAFHKSKAKYRCFFGGFGSGKTTALVYEALMLGLEFPDNRILIGRLTYPELEATTKMEFLKIIPENLIKRNRDIKNDLELVNGTVYLFRALDKADKFKSLNLGAFAIDEASEIGEDMFYMLQSRLRYNKVGRRCGILSTNPEGHNWLWRLFVDKSAMSPELKEATDEFYEHFVSPTTDNVHLPEGYVDGLKKTFSDSWVRRYIYGSFEEFSGLVFFAYDPSRHMASTMEDLNKDGRFIISIDPGIDRTAILFAKHLYTNKRLFVFDEIYRDRIGIEEASNLIKSRISHYKITHPTILIDPSSVREEQTSRSTIKRQFSSFGINTTEANNDVVFGVLRVNDMLKNNKLIVHRNCRNLNNEMSNYFIDERTGKPKAGQADHLCDDLRYICLNLTASEISSKTKEQEIAELRTRRKGLFMYKKHSGKSVRNYLTI